VDDPGDLDLYLALADRADGPVLELAVGTGRLAIPLAEAGHVVTGVDLEACWPARRGGGPRPAAPWSRRRVHFAPDAGKFGLAFIALNSLLVLGAPQRPRSWPADHLAPAALPSSGVAAGCRGPRPVRRPDHARVAAP
jgi:hypothetical protein